MEEREEANGFKNAESSKKQNIHESVTISQSSRIQNSTCTAEHYSISNIAKQSGAFLTNTSPAWRLHILERFENHEPAAQSFLDSQHKTIILITAIFQTGTPSPFPAIYFRKKINFHQ